ncbi:hypothetical protein CDAR_479751 [Caerostris darwini]|uniref:Uncharacterized protein n=1 Tax=Caerostris darwini TaxID=1538125 RepID=A0AAV4SNV8_9ARAC|nr:hypothetical protein CDAR_479751 [Caerostris darwini]
MLISTKREPRPINTGSGHSQTRSCDERASLEVSSRAKSVTRCRTSNCYRGVRTSITQRDWRVATPVPNQTGGRHNMNRLRTPPTPPHSWCPRRNFTGVN